MTARTDALYKTESQIAELVGLRPEEWRAAAIVLERSGLPRSDPLFGDRRYWPAVRAFLDRRHGLGAQSQPLQPDGEENWDGLRQKDQRRTRPKAAAAN